jgi:putative phosphoribosyl transferase
MAQFYDRKEAGQKLAQSMEKFTNRDEVIVLGLPRGGVPVAYEVAKALNAPLDVFIVRKLGAPNQPELAMGAIGSGDVQVMNDQIVQQAGISEQQINRVLTEERKALKNREEKYRGSRPDIDVKGKIAILVDDGLATGASMRAAITALKELSPKKIVVAVPTAPQDTVQSMKSEVEEVICLITPTPFWGVGGSYQNFTQTSDEEVRDLLAKAENN